MTFLETLGYGATVTGIGLVVVFFGLALLIAIISLLSKAIRGLDKAAHAKSESDGKAPEEPMIAEIAKDAQDAQIETEEVSDGELIAVIAAAIAAFDGGNKSLVIRSVRRASGWKNAARAEQVFKY